MLTRSKKRKLEEYISWNDYFMNVAMLASLRSKDPKTKVGSCIIDKNNIIRGTGYNGLPLGFNDNLISWTKNNEIRDNKHSYVIHAEVNAILNSSKFNLEDCTIFITHFPCNDCLKIIIQSKIKNIIYLNDKNNDNKATKRMIKNCNITINKIKNFDSVILKK